MTQGFTRSVISLTGDSGGALQGSSFLLTGGSTGLAFSGSGTTETLGGTLNVANGGSAKSSFTDTSALLCSGTTSTGAFQDIASVATGQVLVSKGTSTLPSYSAYPQITGLGIGASPGSTAGLTFDGSNFMTSYSDKTSWTPAIAFGGGTTGITYSLQQGYYSRIGNIIFVYAVITLSNKGSSTGTFTITGLPFTVSNLSNYSPVGVFLGSQLTGITAIGLTTQFLSNTTTAQVAETKGTGASVLLDNTVFTNTSAFYTSGFYSTG